MAVDRSEKISTDEEKNVRPNNMRNPREFCHLFSRSFALSTNEAFLLKFGWMIPDF